MAGPWPGEVVCVSLGDDQDDGGDSDGGGSDDDDNGGGGGGGGDDDGGGGSGGGDGDNMTMIMVCLLPKKDWLSIVLRKESFWRKSVKFFIQPAR